jgi:hypothetical protein
MKKFPGFNMWKTFENYWCQGMISIIEHININHCKAIKAPLLLQQSIGEWNFTIDQITAENSD